MREYTLIRARRKTVALILRPDGKLTVRAPISMPLEKIEAFVRSRERWIVTHLGRLRSANVQPPPDEAEMERLLARAREVLPPKVRFFAGQMGLFPRSVKINRAKTRYGSCSPRDTLNFSCLLMREEEDLIDYVVVHELAHIARKDHSPAFYAQIARVLPDWRERVKRLRGR